jgi:hypothetical protein
MIGSMTKRILISGLWFISIWGMGGVAHLFMDVPRVLTLVVALTIAGAWWIGLARYEAGGATKRIQAGSPSGYRTVSALQASAK